MASGIPPLLPASPPPMSKDDFNEVETDDSANEDNDEFGDFSIATPADHSTKPTNDVHTSDKIEPTFSETTLSDTSKNQVSEYESEIANSSLQETKSDDENSTRVRLKNEEAVDEFKSSTDDDTIINSFVTVEMPSVADRLSDSPPPDAKSSNLNQESATNDDFKSDLTFDQEITPTENSSAIHSPSSSDSESIDIPDDSFIICEDTHSNHVSDFLATSEKNNKKVDSIFGEFVTSNDDETSGYQVEGYKNLVSSDPLATDPAVLDADFETEFQNSDDFFQPFADVSAPFPNEKVTKLEFKDFGAKIDIPFSDSLSSITETTKQDSELEEIAPVQFSCEFDDDDFSDFVSPTAFVQSKVMEENTRDPVRMQPNEKENVPVSFCETNDISTNEKCPFEQYSVSTTSQELNWTEIFCVPAEDRIEVNVNTIEGKLKCSSVWCKIKDIENSPALHYNWIDSDTNKLLLATLCVDSRNILFGPRWSSEVPRFASNLGFTPLVPQKAADKSPQNEFPDLCSEVTAEIVGPLTELNPTMSSVPDAHFDWNNSGLTNPLDSYSHSSLLDLDLLASFDIHSPYYRKKSKPEKSTVTEDYELQNSVSILNGSETKTLSSEATKILNSLPNLVVMEKQYIVFPIR